MQQRDNVMFFKLQLTFDEWLYTTTRSQACVMSSVQSLDQLGYRGDMRANSEKILFQSFLKEAIVSSSGMGREVHSLTLSTKHFLCQSWYCPSSKVPWRMFGEAVVVCDIDSCQKRFLWTHKEVDLAPHPVIALCSKYEIHRSFLRHLVSKPWILFSESSSRVHVSQPWKRMEVSRGL